MSETEASVEVPARNVADWLENQPGTWWYVDGDPLLTSEVDFPCPNDELAGVLRRIGKSIQVYLANEQRERLPEAAAVLNLDELTNTESPRKEKKILAAWCDSDIKWVLSEDKDMAEEARRNAVESIDAKAAD